MTRKCLLRRLVYLWGARAKHAVLMRISSNMLPQRATYFSDGPIRNHRSWPTPRPRRAVLAILKTRNRLYGSAIREESHSMSVQFCCSPSLCKLDAASSDQEDRYDHTEDQGLSHGLYPWHGGYTCCHTHRTQSTQAGPTV